MEIKFAYHISNDARWQTEDFDSLNTEINNLLYSLHGEGEEKINVFYVGIICLSEALYGVLKPRKLKFHILQKYMDVDIKIPIEYTDWIEVKRFVFNSLRDNLDIAVKKNYIIINPLGKGVY